MALSPKHFVPCALLVVAFGAATVKSDLSFSLSSCTTDDRGELLRFVHTSVSPYPIVLPGNFSVTSTLAVFGDVTGDIILDISIELRLAIFWMEIPCIGGIGSCEFPDVCGLLRDAFGSNSGCPPQFLDDNVPCTCPIAPGNYTMMDGVFRVADLNFFWRWLAQGDYRATARLLDGASREEIACQHMTLTIEKPCTSFWCRIFG